ncbi:MAG: hypothetical protein BWX56_00855 [Euryarchaeota archaeon ADurb.Bin023]|nr:MAG: hypothetical protein BWX56_00855 [Euryarchaeota archaeon ADurb.Bin023]
MAKSFHIIAVPHKDILEKELTLNTFAADLWGVSKKTAPEEYRDKELFFSKTYLTEGMQTLLSVVEMKLKGEGGEPVIQIQTPFGGGKTHTMIALYHKASDWGAKPVVIVGSVPNSEKNTLWAMIEEQLTGKNEAFKSRVSPGREDIIELLSNHQPVLILIDELLEYISRASGITVGDSTLATQSIAFIQELTEAVSSLDNCCLITSLPSSILEHYDKNAELLFRKLQKVSGRMERIYEPVHDEEITKVIRRRLFGSIDEKALQVSLKEIMEYMEQENLIPDGLEVSEYRDKFMASYPFQPEVINILYHRWGSYSTFQRTRGVLRLLSLVIQSLKNRNIPYVSVSDFNLSNSQIKEELLKHIGPEFNSVIAADITDKTSGAKKIDISLGDAYRDLSLGTRTAISTFMYSFSGGQEKGITLKELKRVSTTLDNPANTVTEAVEKMKSLFFYLQTTEDKYFFTNQPNINRILLTKMENIHQEEIESYEKNLLINVLRGKKVSTYLWPSQNSDVPDTEDLKLVILREKNDKYIQEILNTKGSTPRVNRNTIIFLAPYEMEKKFFDESIQRLLAYEKIEKDLTLSLSESQRKLIKEQIKQGYRDIELGLRRLYRLMIVPAKDSLKEEDLGFPTFGINTPINDLVFEKLKGFEILDSIAPIVLREKYLKGKDYVETSKIFDTSLRTLGEARILSRSVLINAINQGVALGLFGLGYLINDVPTCQFYKENPMTFLSDEEIIICAELCKKEEKKIDEINEKEKPREFQDSGKSQSKDFTTSNVKVLDHIELNFEIPFGKVSDILGMLNFIRQKYNKVEITINATKGEMKEEDYINKVEETLRQIGAK